MKLFVVGLLVIAMVLLPVSAQELSSEPLSKSLVRSTSNVFQEVLSNIHSNAHQPGDWARAEIAYRVLFEHMKVTGINDAWNLAFRLHQSELASMKVTSAMVESLHVNFPGITESELRKSAALVPKLVEEFETVGGIEGLEARILLRVHAKAEREAAYLSGTHVAHVRCCGPACNEVVAEGGLLAAGFGVASLFGCVACVPVSAGLLFGAALLQWLCV